jgi:hypothetical protein
MASAIESNKPKSRKQQRSNSDSPLKKTTNTTQTFTIQHDNKSVEGKVAQEAEKQTRRKRRRSTKVGLNDTLRRIRHLLVEGQSNLDIQSILQLNERTFYRYMAKIYKIDQALFVEQEKKTMATEIGVFKDRLLKGYQWFMEMAKNEKMNQRIRVEAQRNALEVAWALVMLESEGPRLIQQTGGVLGNLYHISSYPRPKKAEARKSSSSSSFSLNEDGEEGGEEKADDQQKQQYLQEDEEQY